MIRRTIFFSCLLIDVPVGRFGRCSSAVLQGQASRAGRSHCSHPHNERRISRAPVCASYNGAPRRPPGLPAPREAPQAAPCDVTQSRVTVQDVYNTVCRRHPPAAWPGSRGLYRLPIVVAFRCILTAVQEATWSHIQAL